MPKLEQSAYNSVEKWRSRTVTATFNRPTTPGSLLVAVCAAAGTLPSRLSDPPGWTRLDNRGLRDIQQAVWYRQNAPATTSVSTTSLDDDKSLQLRVLEYSGVAKANALDDWAVYTGSDDEPYTGRTDTTTSSDALVLGFITNQYASTSQYGFYGGLTRLYDTTSPTSWVYWQQDWERSRLTVHERIPSGAATSWQLGSNLSTDRRWIALIATFKGASLGPALFTSTVNTKALDTEAGDRSSLTVFGPLASGVAADSTAVGVSAGGGDLARIGPFDYQYRLGGWSGLTIGVDTPYRVEGHDGLEGWDIRTSDTELPRGDGAVRGVDLQSAREMLFRVNTSSLDPAEVEEALDTLYRALVPQRDDDWELIWRHPGRALRMMRVRPINLVRELNARQMILANQEFALRAADPRHYSAFVRTEIIPNTPASGAEVPIAVINEGNGFAYPLVRIDGPPPGADPLTRIEVRNATIDSSFVVTATLPPRSTLLGDMEARATGAARSVVTIDGASKYGAWAHPREPFRLAPGANDITLLTQPAGAAVSAVLTYRDTWSG